jgi:DNA-binding transcriptional LysR family regulator
MDELAIDSSLPMDQGLLSGHYWGELRIFAEVAKAKSFNRAAEKLGMSQPTISRKVKRLQDLVGSQLLVPTKLGVRLTPRGEELARALMTLDLSLFAITSDLKAKSKDAEGVVRISITDGLAAFFAAPNIEALSQRFPRIQLHLKGMINLNDLRENQTDMMLGFAPIERSDIVCKRLGSLHFVPLASKQYIARMGLPTRTNLEDHLFLQSHFYETKTPVWADWQRACARGRIAHLCDDTFAYGLLAKLGLGIALLGTYVISEPVAVPLDLGFTTSLPLYGLALAERLHSKPVKLVYDWLCDIFSDANPWLRTEIRLSDILPNCRFLASASVSKSQYFPGTSAINCLPTSIVAC